MRYDEIAAADLYITYFHDHVFRVEFSVAALKRLRHSFYGVDDFQAFDQIDIDCCRVTDQSENSLKFTI